MGKINLVITDCCVVLSVSVAGNVIMSPRPWMQTMVRLNLMVPLLFPTESDFNQMLFYDNCISLYCMPVGLCQAEIGMMTM